MKFSNNLKSSQRAHRYWIRGKKTLDGRVVVSKVPRRRLWDIEYTTIPSAVAHYGHFFKKSMSVIKIAHCVF